jgi:hypothetical protein
MYLYLNIEIHTYIYMYVYILHVENKTRLKPGTMYHVVLQRLELVARHVRYQMVKYQYPY